MKSFEQKFFTAIRPKRSRVKKSRRARRGPWRSEAYRRWVASLPCLICGRHDVQAAHTENNGMRSKGPDSSCVPLCLDHHREYDAGRAAFEDRHTIRLQARAAELFQEWSTPEPECSCSFLGDQADARGCAAHGRAA